VPLTTLVLAAADELFSWLTLTASFGFSPSSTLTIFLFPALIPPDLVTLGPPIMVKPFPVRAVLGIPNGPFTNTPAPLTAVLANALPVLTPKPSTVVLKYELPVVRPERSSVVVLPSPKGELEPISTLPLLPRSRLLLSLTSILPFFTLVSILSLEPTTSTA